MNRPILFLCFCFFAMVSWAQQERLPADLRQHNLTTYNASLFNPAFSLDRNNPESVALWVRWQWQGIDSDPSTLFLNYTRKLDERSAAGAAFFQHNTGIFFNTGGAVNYAYKFDLNPRVKLSVGANLFGFQQKLADDRFQVDPTLPLPIETETNDFILQFAPGISLEVERLTLSLASENLLDYNFGAKEGNTSKEDKIFMSLLSYDFPINLGSATNAFLRPSMYLRTIPGQSNQVGFYTMLNTDTYWGHVGYNNFYGFALGGGYTFFDRVMVGALAEFGTGASIVKESSFELMASYFLGTPSERHKMVGHDLEEDVLNPLESIEKEQDAQNPEEEPIEKSVEEESEKDEEISAEKQKEAERKEAEKQQKETEKLKKQEAKQRAKQEKAVQDSIAKQQKKIRDSVSEREKAVRDSIAKQKKEAAAAIQKQQKEAEKEAARVVKQEEARKKAEEKEAELQGIKREEQEKEAMEKEAMEQEAAEQGAAKEEAEEKRAVEREASEKTAAEAERQKAAQEKAEAETIKAEQQRKIDSVANARAAAIRAVREAEEAKSDIQEVEADAQPQAGEKYEEVSTEAGLLPGYYLIANVFGTKKYYDAFMNDLKSKGMQPKSFRRSTNGFNYVYLQRYKTIQQARAARDDQYSGPTWIFRVTGK